VRKVSNSKVTTQEVADILGIHISDLRRMMREGKIAAPPIIFDSGANSVGRMWSEDDVEAVRTALKTASANS
jgi:predicted site-specific integrase-resolvase